MKRARSMLEAFRFCIVISAGQLTWRWSKVANNKRASGWAKTTTGSMFAHFLCGSVCFGFLYLFLFFSAVLLCRQKHLILLNDCGSGRRFTHISGSTCGACWPVNLNFTLETLAATRCC